MTASLVGSWSATATATTSVGATTPAATIQEGDLLLAVVARSASVTPSGPSGWETANLAGIKNSDSTLAVFSASSPTGGSALFWKVATALDEGGDTYTWTGTSANWGLVVMAWRGVAYPTRGGVVDEDLIFESCTDTTRSGSTLIGANQGLAGADAPRSRYLMIATFTHCVTSVAADLGLPLGSTLTEVANLSVVGCSTLVAYELIDLAENPGMGGGNRYCETDQASGNGRGWLFLVVDDDAVLELVEVGAGGGADAVPPAVTLISPDPAAAPGEEGGFPADYETAKDTPIVLSIADPDPGLLDVRVVRVYDVGSGGGGGGFELGTLRGETVYEDGAFWHPYTSSTAEVVEGALVLTIRHVGGWPRGTTAIRFRVVAIDGDGNLTEVDL